MELVELFMENSTPYLERLRSAIDQGNLQQAVDTAHYVKGIA